jgi:hypothetical protein
MPELPTLLCLAIWLVGSLYLIRVFAHLVGAPIEIVYIAAAVGICAGVVEWITLRQDR